MTLRHGHGEISIRCGESHRRSNNESRTDVGQRHSKGDRASLVAYPAVPLFVAGCARRSTAFAREAIGAGLRSR